MRCAIYFTPPADDPLTLAASRWLGRDAYTGARIEGVETAGIVPSDRAFLTAPPRRYGFHGTLRAPFDIISSFALPQLTSALSRFCGSRQELVIPAMRIALLDDFFALVPATHCETLTELSTAVVTEFERFCSPVGEAEFAKRGRAHLTDRQLRYLLRWGWPYVFEEFRFHMTLTGPVPTPERAHVQQVLEHHFGALSTAPVTLNQLALFVEPEPYAPFLVNSTHSFAQTEIRKIA